jgi:hypothetical protein
MGYRQKPNDWRTMTDTIEAVKEETEIHTLNTNDRCDYCGSQAYFWVNGINGDLLFCRHDFLKWEDKLRAYSFEIIDESHKLGIKVESSA